MYRSEKQHTKSRHRIIITFLCLFAIWVVATYNMARPNINISNTNSLMLDSIKPLKRNTLKDTVTSEKPLLIKIESAESVTKKQKLDYQILKDNVVFFHDGAYLYCDSAYYNEKDNNFEAFSNVRMVQGDTIFLTGRYMHYDGNTMLAKVRYNVELENRPQKVTLFTDSLDYDRRKNIGYYPNGGKLVDTLNTLTSNWGQYEPNIKLARFLDDVVLINPSFILNSEALDYHTDTRMAELLDKSKIVSDSGIIYTTKGWYNTNNQKSILYNRSQVLNNVGDKILTGDTIFYDREKGYGEVFGNMQLEDTLKKVILRGHYLYYNELTDYAIALDSAYCIEYSQGDSLYIHADTLELMSEEYPVLRKTDLKQLFKTDTTSVVDKGQQNLFQEADSLYALNRSSAELEEAKLVDTIQPNVDILLNLSDSMKVDYEVPTLNIDLSKTDSIPLFESDSSRIDMDNSLMDSTKVAIKEPRVVENPNTLEYVLKHYPNGIRTDTMRMEMARVIKGYHGVRFYRTDMQGVCDSLQFSTQDSIIHLYRDPVLWNDNNQVYGDTIDIIMEDSTINFVHVKRYSFSIEHIRDSVLFNQLKGRSMKVFFEDGAARRIFVQGNAESVYYPEEKEKSIIGLNWMESSELEILLKDGQLEKMRTFSKTTGSITPLKLVEPEQLRLEGFYWFDYLRPLNKRDIFRKVSKKVSDQRPKRLDIFD